MSVKIFGSTGIEFSDSNQEIKIKGSTQTFSLKATTNDEFTVNNAANKLWGISSAGLESKPNKPSFRSYISPESTSIGIYLTAANGVTWVTATSSNVYNIGNHFSGGVFTAPIGGIYHFAVMWDGQATTSQLDLYINETSAIVRWEPTGNANNWESFSYSTDCFLNVGDYVSLYARGGSGSYPYHMGGGYWGFFAGHFLG